MLAKSGIVSRVAPIALKYSSEPSALQLTLQEPYFQFTSTLTKRPNFSRYRLSKVLILVLAAWLSLTSTNSLAAPSTPTRTSPGSTSAPGPTLSDLYVELSWRSSSGATYYDLGIRNVDTGELIVDTQTADTYYTRGGLEPGTLYRWNVAACDFTGCSTFSQAKYFTTPVVPPTPRRLSPGYSTSPGKLHDQTWVDLTWASSAGATYYDVGVRNLDTGQLIADFTTTGTTVDSLGGLDQDTAYRWNVAACNAVGCSNFAAPRYFYTPPIPSRAPSGLEPGSTSPPGPDYVLESVLLDWNRVSGASSYAISGGPVEYPNLGTRVTGPPFRPPEFVIGQNGGIHVWRVSSCNAFGCSSYSPYRYINLIDAPEVDTDSDGEPDISDNCPSVPNEGQSDYDGNGIGDACERPIVVFLPGFMGSRLWNDRLLNEDKIWINDRNDLCKLGDEGVYTKPYSADSEGNSGLIKYALGYRDIYGGFARKLDDWKTRNVIKDWKSIPYNWNDSVIDIAKYGTRTKIEEDRWETQGIVNQVISLGRAAPIVLIGHSNGGILAKAVMMELEARAKSELVSHLILVASPQAGTAKAIPALLHGEMGLADLYFEVYLREAGEDSIGAHTLLPSNRYSELDNGSSELIIFDSSGESPVPELLAAQSKYGIQSGDVSIIYSNNLNSDLLPFLTASEGDRQETGWFEDNCENASLNVDNKIPNILSQSVINHSIQIHDILDYWEAPTSTKFSEVIGHGIPTTRGVSYQSKEVCAGGKCTNILSHTNTSTKLGDGTVVSWSAAASIDAKEYYIDLETENNTDYCASQLGDESLCNSDNVEHSNITSSKGVQRVIESLILDRHVQESAVVSRLRPDSFSDWLEVSIASPVELHIYDIEGRHTGPISASDSSIEGILLENKIPNSYIEFVDGHHNISLAVGREYHIELIGTDIGTFSITIEQKNENGTLNKHELRDIPVSDNSNAFVNISENSTIDLLELDFNGDDTTDFYFETSELTPNEQLLRVLLRMIESLELHSGTYNSIESKIIKAENYLSLGEQGFAVTELSALVNFLNAQSNKKLDGKIASNLVDIVLTIQRRIESQASPSIN